MDNSEDSPWRRQSESEGSGSQSSEQATTPLGDPEKALFGPPPPPPPPSAGSIPAVRLNSEISRKDKGPPAALATAMAKDKKPFTYTPGGIDLSEIKSPRMAKRLQMNALSEGVTSEPKPMSSEAPRVQTPLTPAAAAAMQPCMAIPVFPTGFPSQQVLNRTPGRSAPDYTHAPQVQSTSQPPPSATPHQQVSMTSPTSPKDSRRSPSAPPSSAPSPPQYETAPPPPPPPQLQNVPPPPPPPMQRQSSVEYKPIQFTPKPYSGNVNAPNSSCFGNRYPTPGNEPITSIANKVTTNGTNNVFPPAPTSPVEQSYESKPSQQPTKAQARSQNLESIYIPPMEQKSNGRFDGNSNEKQAHDNSSSTSLDSSRSNATIVIPTPPSAANPPRNPWQVASPTTSASSPMTPQLNKAPTPWMNSFNRMQKQPQTPPYVTTPDGSSGNTPWGTSPVGRTIPIAMEKTVGESNDATRPQHSRTRSVPIQIQSNNSTPSTPVDGAKSIPIQIERQQGGKPQGYVGNKVMAPVAYNNPMGLYSNQNAQDAFDQQAGEIAKGMEKLNTNDDPPIRDPMQSKAIRVIQKVAEKELKKQQQRFGLAARRGISEAQHFRFAEAAPDAGQYRGNSSSKPYGQSHVQTIPIQIQQQSQTPPTVKSTPYTIPIRMTSQSPNPVQQQQPTQKVHQIKVDYDSSNNQGRRTPSEQTSQGEMKYMGNNIPSRSFKILQAMTVADAEADVSQSEDYPDEEAERSSPPPNSYLRNDRSSPYPENMDPSYAYMSWYYWWYYNNYAGYYWPNNGYGYEYPPMNPPPMPPPMTPPPMPPTPFGDWGGNGYNFFPPEMYRGYQRSRTPGPRSRPSSCLGVPVPENGFKSRCYVDTDDIQVPKIVVQETGRKARPRSCYAYVDNPSKGYCDEESFSVESVPSESTSTMGKDFVKNDIVENGRQQLDTMRDDDTDIDLEDWTETIASNENEVEQSVIACETGEATNSRRESKDSQPESLNEENGERTEDEEESSATSTITLTLTNGTCSLVGVVDEPETPNSEDSETLREDDRCQTGIDIEEYFSESSDGCKIEEKKKLSTIDEITETERSRSRLSSLPEDSVRMISEVLDELEEAEESDESGESEDSESEEEQDDEEEEEEEIEDEAEESTSETEPSSSISVIENKSEPHISSSYPDESNMDEEDEISAEDENSSSSEDEDHENAAVTVRLPLRLSFGKTKSSKDITTLLVGTSEMKEEPLELKSKEEKTLVPQQINFEVSETKEETGDEEDNEPVVSFTISLSRQNSKNEEETKATQEEETVDFWSVINQDTTDSKETSCETFTLAISNDNQQDSKNKIMTSRSREFTSIDDLWADKEDMDAIEHELQTTYQPTSKEEFNFWEKRSISVEPDTNDKNRLSSGFEISENYESDSGCNIRGKVGYWRKKKRTSHLRKRHSICSASNMLPPLPHFKRGKESLKVGGCSSSSNNNNNSEETLVHYPSSSGTHNNEEAEQSCFPTASFTPTSSRLSKSGGKNGVVTTAETDERNYSSESHHVYYEELNSCQEKNSTSLHFINLPERQTLSNSCSNGDDGGNIGEVTTRTTTHNSSINVEEGSDESSKDSSNATTIDVKEDDTTSTTKKYGEDEGRQVEIQRFPEKIKLAGNEQEETCTCKERMSRAENLLWRIERFLHESLSLGSEDDSGVMTDVSRQISDVDTDGDDPTEFLLSTAAAAAAVHKRYAPSVAKEAKMEPCTTVTKETEVVRRRPQSDIFGETVTTPAMENGTNLETGESEVKMRNTSAERKALRYQRAKTHSRLFQLLQTESTGQEEDEETFMRSIVLQEEKESFRSSSVVTNTTESEVKSSSNDQQMMRSRLMPLPFKNILQSSGSCDSNSSPSGSSGVISPTSPVTKDQLLADIINEFHVRHQSQHNNNLSVRRRTKKSFPSKIFKLLQNEFGEEFYQTFDCSGNELLADNGFNSVTMRGLGDLVDGFGQSAKECVIHKSESLERMEKEQERQHQNGSAADYFSRTTPSPNIEKIMGEQRKLDDDSRKGDTNETIHVPIRRKKAVLGRDPRIPKGMMP